MGVDTDTYRCRVGLFVPSRGAGMVMIPFVFDFSHVVKLIGAVSFVRILLLIAGIEQNPGPAVFIFRYQYLLIEIGTFVLRELFDILVNKDFMQYLNGNHKQYDQLKFLMDKGIITDPQKNFLPPVDMKPNSSNFDITLLACLLKNVCGLRDLKDAVWNTPAPTDYSIEADITRLRTCRNNLVHIGTVFMSETDLTSKWNELSDILNRINITCKIKDLPTRIADAKSMEIDKELSSHYNRIIGDIVESETDIQQGLMNSYMENCINITVSPLFRFENEKLLKLYKIPTFFLTEYHGAQLIQKEVTSCNQIFYKKDKKCRNIYITGDAGVGKTSFCQFLCLLWYMSKSDIDIVNEEMKEYVDFIEKYDFVFYIALRDSVRIDVIAIIVDQLFYSECSDEWNKIYSCIKNILKNKECLVILDGLDEWKPDAKGKVDTAIPSRIYFKKCVYLTTCRPYKTENLQLLKDLDHQVKIAGITGKSSTDYIKDVVRYINEKNSVNKDPERFQTEVMECGLADLLCLPIITSHLVAAWFGGKLTNMSRTLIYGNIVVMLFQLAVNRKIELSPSTDSDLQLPDPLSDLKYINKHVPLLQKVCLLSFRSLFTQDECVATLVFTAEQLGSDPYFLNPEQMDLLCKIGILSKNKINRIFGKQEQKLNFLHLSYLEFFAALFVSSFDRDNRFNDIVKNWTSLNHVLPFQNFFLFLAGFSIKRVSELFDTVFQLISNDLTVFRRNTIFHYLSSPYHKQLKSLQTIVINCMKESRRSCSANVFIKLEDFYFEDKSNIEILTGLIDLNKACTKSIYSEEGKYFDVFDQIKDLQILNVGDVLPTVYERFTQFILENKSTLHTIRINGDINTEPLIPELPVRSLQHLTSLSLSRVKMQHYSLHNLVTFLSDSVHIENIKLFSVYCVNHHDNDSDCKLTLNLPHHTKLTSLYLWNVHILCNNVNTDSLKTIALYVFCEVFIVRKITCYIDIFNCVKESQLECFAINGHKWLDNKTVETLIHTVNTLPYIKLLVLRDINLPDEFLLRLHTEVKQVEIELHDVTMSRQCIHSFIENIVNLKTVIKVLFRQNKNKGVKESFDYMSENLASEPKVNILHKEKFLLVFETSCH